jgi:hypothetical protein
VAHAINSRQKTLETAARAALTVGMDAPRNITLKSMDNEPARPRHVAARRTGTGA